MSNDEINQIDISPSGRFLASADDSGDTTLMDLDTGTSYRCLSGIHENICSTVAFSSRSEAELISGGLDCQIVGWNYERNETMWCRKMGCEFGGQVYNPPMVHCVASPLLSPDQDKWPGLSAAARGDGSIWVGFGQGFCSYSEDVSDPGEAGESADFDPGEFGESVRVALNEVHFKS